MSVVRRAAAATVVAGLVLLGGPAWAQEDPCAPDADGNVAEMCQGGEVVESGAGAGAEDPCPPQPVEPGDGVVVDDGEGTDPGPAPDEETRSEPAPDEETVAGPAPGTVSEDDGVMCAFGAPVDDSAPVLESVAVDTAAGGESSARSDDRGWLLVAAAGGALAVAGGGLALARRRAQQQ